jgi:protein-L-isoaspartate(D-aspartate) O-methyltransferase
MNFALQRHKMVVEQLEKRGIRDSRVLEAMEWVPREEFVPPEMVGLAYEDRALPIGLEQTISQPYTVAYMCQEAQVAADEKVLEIGAGSGYGAAVLSLLAREVHTIERIDELYRNARERLARLSYENVRIYHDDGTRGLPTEAPFDAILVTAGADRVPDLYLEQVAEGGRIVMPVGPSSQQEMLRMTRRGDQWLRQNLGSFGFVPLVGGEM